MSADHMGQAEDAPAASRHEVPPMLIQAIGSYLMQDQSAAAYDQADLDQVHEEGITCTGTEDESAEVAELADCEALCDEIFADAVEVQSMHGEVSASDEEDDTDVLPCSY